MSDADLLWNELLATVRTPTLAAVKRAYNRIQSPHPFISEFALHVMAAELRDSRRK